jgi:hypothetical protein
MKVVPSTLNRSWRKSELKKNPMGVLVQGEGHPEPQQACVPAQAYEELLEHPQRAGADQGGAG